MIAIAIGVVAAAVAAVVVAVVIEVAVARVEGKDTDLAGRCCGMTG